MSTPYQIYYVQAGHYVRMDWDGYATSAQFKEGTELMLKTLKQHGATKVLADVKDMTIIGREDQNYVQFNFLPRAIDGGFRAIALIRPVSYFNAVAVETMSYRVKQTVVQMRIFDNEEDAIAWLDTIDNDSEK